jgi:hypothetical protein
MCFCFLCLVCPVLQVYLDCLPLVFSNVYLVHLCSLFNGQLTNSSFLLILFVLSYLTYTRQRKQKHITKRVGHHYLQTNTNNINKTWVLNIYIIRHHYIQTNTNNVNKTCVLNIHIVYMYIEDTCLIYVICVCLYIVVSYYVYIEDTCLIYVICVCLYRVVSNSFCDVFLFSLSCVTK